MGGINDCGIVLNLTQSLSISIRVKKSLSNVVVKDIESTPPLRLRLLKKFKSLQWNYLKIGKLILT